MTDLPPAVQQQIIEEFRENKDAFSQVYDFYFEPLFRFILKRTMSAAVAYDLNAETFLKAYNNFGRFEWKNISIKVWLFRIAVNELKNYFRAPKALLSVDPELLENHATVSFQEEMSALNASLFEDERLQELRVALLGLSLEYQNLISLYYFTGLSQKEIAETLEKSPQAVKAMMHRAITQLRSSMKSSHPFPPSL